MRLSTARDLKQELVSQVRVDLIEPRVLALRRARSARIRVPSGKSVIAFGISPIPGSKRDFALAVRAFPGHERYARRMIANLRTRGRELDLATGVRYQPRTTLRAGGSCGHFQITAGTLGGFVEDDGDYYVLSNNHVLANSDAGNVGDPILQPGPADVKNSRFKVIGHLSRWIQLSPRRSNGVDAALATFDPQVKDFYPWFYTGIGTMPSEPVADRFEVSKVVKRGRTTGVTRGTVSAFELDGVSIDYGEPGNPKVVSFDDQLEFIHQTPERKAFSQPGDSGSFILDADTLRPYALLYAGGPDDQGIDRTLGHFMPDVLSSLKVQLVQ